MPDFDVDFCMDKRDELIAYVARTYGETSVGQIATFHELKARSVIKDVARAMQFEPQEAARLASLLPIKGQGQTDTIPEVLAGDIEPRLTALMSQSWRHRVSTRRGSSSGGALPVRSARNRWKRGTASRRSSRSGGSRTVKPSSRARRSPRNFPSRTAERSGCCAAATTRTLMGTGRQRGRRRSVRLAPGKGGGCRRREPEQDQSGGGCEGSRG